MQAAKRSIRGSGSRSTKRISHLLLGGFVFATLLISGTAARPQTLARPGWAGSGLIVERWWPHAVLCEVEPGSLAQGAEAGQASTLHRLASRLEDLQTLGVDAVLLRGLEPEVRPQTSAGKTPGGAVEIADQYGTLDEFDELVGTAVRHGMRVLVELRPSLAGTGLTDDARFWLNHGVTGLALPEIDPGAIRSVRAVLRGYVGERVLIAEANGTGPAAISQQNLDLTDADIRNSSRHPSAHAALRADGPDLLRVSLPPVAQGAAAMRTAIERARAMLGARPPFPLLSATKASDPAAARVLATALLGSGGAVLLQANDLDLAHAAGSEEQTSIFAWYRHWSGLHRGNAVMRSGDETLLDHDADGALVWVRQLRGGVPIIAICNVTGKPLRFSLVNDIQRLRLRGSFLRTVARSDGGMGAMPLREVVLPPFGVYVGELSR